MGLQPRFSPVTTRVATEIVTDKVSFSYILFVLDDFFGCVFTEYEREKNNLCVFF
jgi:hypothetical protein